MKCSVTIDWKFMAALGTAAVGFFCVSKMDGDSVERVLTHVVYALKKSVIAENGSH